MGTTGAILDTDHLLKVHNDIKTRYLPDKQAQNFYHTVARLIFMSARERQYIYMAPSFITIHVQKPDEDNWVKLKYILKYLKLMRKLELNLIIVDISVVEFWLDTSYTVY